MLLAQQVAEKAIKGFLYATGEEIVVGHSVQRLTSDAGESDPGFVENSSRWSALDAYYIPTRYPNGLPDSIPALVYTQDTAQSAVALARDAVEFVSGKIDGLEREQQQARKHGPEGPGPDDSGTAHNEH